MPPIVGVIREMATEKQKISEETVRQIVDKYYDGYGLKLICYACPRITWIPIGDGKRDWVLRHDHVYYVDIQAAGGLIIIQVSENDDEDIIRVRTLKELYKWLADFINEKAVMAIEAVITTTKTAWEDKETYDRLFDTATLRFLSRND
jgi:hypothetical protein